jgi:predicted transcriptional regulator
MNSRIVAGLAKKGEPMARRKSLTLTEVELEFMQIIWAKGEVTTDSLQEALRKQDRRLADGSIRKVLSILVAKGYVQRRPEGKGFVYWASAEAARTKTGLVEDIVRRAFGGSAALMVAALIDGRAVSRKELKAIRKLLDEREKGCRP